MLVVFGDNKLAEVIVRLLPEEVAACVVDDEYHTKDVLSGVPVIKYSRFLADIASYRNHKFVVSLGYNALAAKKTVAERLGKLGITFCDIFLNGDANRSRADYSSTSGNIYFENVVTEVGSSVGHHNVFWSNVTLCHDSRVGNFSFFSSGSILGGGAEVGDCCFVGFNAVMDSGSKLASGSILGALSFLKGKQERSGTYLGCPAALRHH